MEIPQVVKQLIKKLKAKIDDSNFPQGCYYGRINKFFDVASNSVSARYQMQSDQPFENENFI